MLNLYTFFKAFENQTYTIIKLSNEFPKYKSGSDIDIFCLNTENVAKIILQLSNKYINKGYVVEVNDKENQIHIDFLLAEKIDFRFDLYKKLPKYENLEIKPAFFESVIENSIQKKINKNFTIFVPNIIDDLIIRYIEYQEWYSKSPDKIKHIDYIKEYISDKNLKIKFLNKLHHYTQLKRNYVEQDRQIRESIHKEKTFLRRVKTFLRRVKTFLKRILTS